MGNSHLLTIHWKALWGYTFAYVTSTSVLSRWKWIDPLSAAAAVRMYVRVYGLMDGGVEPLPVPRPLAATAPV